jgi:hypothetical protein
MNGAGKGQQRGVQFESLMGLYEIAAADSPPKDAGAEQSRNGVHAANFLTTHGRSASPLFLGYSPQHRFLHSSVPAAANAIQAANAGPKKAPDAATAAAPAVSQASLHGAF